MRRLLLHFEQYKRDLTCRKVGYNISHWHYLRFCAFWLRQSNLNVRIMHVLKPLLCLKAESLSRFDVLLRRCFTRPLSGQ